MKRAGEALSEPAADPRDEHAPAVGQRLEREAYVCAFSAHQKMLFLALRPRLSIDWIVAFTSQTFSSMTASSSS